MKKENGFWIDENNNKWDCMLFTEEQAVHNSSTLINCTNCANCSDCRNCTYCTNCSYCRNCTNCVDCTYCTYCTNCRNCTTCTNCTNCRNCTTCRYCTNCIDFKTNPQRYVSKNIGSRNAQTHIYWVDSTVQVVCGCFTGSIEEFKTAVTFEHGNNEYAQQYFKLIDAIIIIIDMNV